MIYSDSASSTVFTCTYYCGRIIKSCDINISQSHPRHSEGNVDQRDQFKLSGSQARWSIDAISTRRSQVCFLEYEVILNNLSFHAIASFFVCDLPVLNVNRKHAKNWQCIIFNGHLRPSCNIITWEKCPASHFLILVVRYDHVFYTTIIIFGGPQVLY